MKDRLFRYINASAFFSDYLPQIKNFKHKIRGKNGRGNHVDFTKEEKKEVKAALRKFLSEIKYW